LLREIEPDNVQHSSVQHHVYTDNIKDSSSDGEDSDDDDDSLHLTSPDISSFSGTADSRSTDQNLPDFSISVSIDDDVDDQDITGRVSEVVDAIGMVTEHHPSISSPSPDFDNTPTKIAAAAKKERFSNSVASMNTDHK
jgi:hypothetical protein